MTLGRKGKRSQSCGPVIGANGSLPSALQIQAMAKLQVYVRVIRLLG
jgi:hypothetical protein